MFSDLQTFFWLTYGDIVLVELLIFAVAMISVLVIVVSDRGFAYLLEWIAKRRSGPYS